MEDALGTLGVAVATDELNANDEVSSTANGQSASSGAQNAQSTSGETQAAQPAQPTQTTQPAQSAPVQTQGTEPVIQMPEYELYSPAAPTVAEQIQQAQQDANLRDLERLGAVTEDDQETDGNGYISFVNDVPKIEEIETAYQEISQENTGVRYISEQDYELRLAVLMSQKDGDTEYDAPSAYSLGFITYEEAINNTYNDVDSQIDALKEQRRKSQMVDDMADMSFDTEAEAAVSFAEAAVLETGKDAKERVAVIINMPVSVVDENGEIVMKDSYVISKTFVGDHDNVISELASIYGRLIPELIMTDNTISFVHTHPYCTGHVANQFSGEQGKDVSDIMGALVDNLKQGKALGDGLGDYLGDAQVPWLPGVDKMYLASPTLGELYAYDENGPIMNQNDPTKYEVIANFNANISGAPYNCK